MIQALSLGVLVAILVVVIGILTAVKAGFNEVIKGLEAVEARLTETKRP